MRRRCLRTLATAMAVLAAMVMPPAAQASPQVSYYDVYCTSLGWVEAESVFWASDSPNAGGSTSAFHVIGTNQTIIIYAVPPSAGDEDSWCWFAWKGGAPARVGWETFDGWAFITPRAQSVAEPPSGWLTHLTEGRVWFVRQSGSWECLDLHLNVVFAFGSGHAVAPGDAPLEVAYATADYWATDECRGGMEYGPHLTGAVLIHPDDFAFDGLNSAWLSDVSIGVSGAGYFQVFELDLALAATSNPIAWNVHNGVLLPPGGFDVSPWGERHNEHYVTADATASVTDFWGWPWFTSEDVQLAEIGQFTQIWR